MTIITWIFIGINVLVALFLLTMLFDPGQDAAGKGMLGLPVIVLLGMAVLAWWLMQRHYPVAALIVSGIPALIAQYVAFLTLKK